MVHDPKLPRRSLKVSDVCHQPFLEQIQSTVQKHCTKIPKINKLIQIVVESENQVCFPNNSIS